MTPLEATKIHTRLLKCALEVEESRAYWAHTDGAVPITVKEVFEAYWFGAKSLDRVEVLLANMRARFDAYPPALRTLHRWQEMSPLTRQIICHWHLQLADPLYRAFTGDFLVRRRQTRPEVTRDLVVSWVGQQAPNRWTMPTMIQFASKLLSASHSAGLVASNRDPRPLVIPTVSDEAIHYILYLLREIRFEGTLLQNPYLASLGLEGRELEARLASLTGLTFQRQSSLTEWGWRYSDLETWASKQLQTGESS